MNAILSQSVLNDIVLSQFHYFSEDIQITDTSAHLGWLSASCEVEFTLSDDCVRIEMDLDGQVTNAWLYDAAGEKNPTPLAINEEHWLCQLTFDVIQNRHSSTLDQYANELRKEALAEGAVLRGWS